MTNPSIPLDDLEEEDSEEVNPSDPNATDEDAAEEGLANEPGPTYEPTMENQPSCKTFA